MSERSRDRAHGNYNNVRQGVERDARTDHQEQKRRTKMGKQQLTKQPSQVKAAKDKARAVQLRKEYPHSEIPARLSRPAFKNLLLRLKQKELPKKAARKSEMVNPGGISLSNPIIVD